MDEDFITCEKCGSVHVEEIAHDSVENTSMFVCDSCKDTFIVEQFER